MTHSISSIEAVFADPAEHAPAPVSWQSATLAGTALDAALGAIAGGLSPSSGTEYGVTFFVAMAAAAGLSGGALVPGWVWAGRRFAPLAILCRIVVVELALALGIVVGLAMGFTIILLPFSFFAAAAIVGLGSAAADRLDQRIDSNAPTVMRIDRQVFGAIIGVVLIFGASAIVGQAASALTMPAHSWIIGLVFGPITLVAASLPHRYWLIEARRSVGEGPPPRRVLMTRAALGSAVLGALGLIGALLAFY